MSVRQTPSPTTRRKKINFKFDWVQKKWERKLIIPLHFLKDNCFIFLCSQTRNSSNQPTNPSVPVYLYISQNTGTARSRGGLMFPASHLFLSLKLGLWSNWNLRIYNQAEGNAFGSGVTPAVLDPETPPAQCWRTSGTFGVTKFSFSTLDLLCTTYISINLILLNRALKFY